MTFDIYIVEHVEELKRDYADLMARYREVAHENAMLGERLDRYRRHRTHEEDYEWMNG